VAALVPSVGTITLKIELRSARLPQEPAFCTSTCCRRASLIFRQQIVEHMNRRHITISVFAGTIAGSLWAWVPAAWSGSPSPVGHQASYLPIQSIS
jgi:hypothetical protein